MSPTVALLRAISLLALVSPMFIGKCRPSPEDRLMPHKTIRARLVVFANFGAVGLFYLALFVFAGSTHTPWALALGVAGCVIAVTGSVIVRRSRVALGPAWSLLPKAGEQTGVVTSGPYRLIRHPGYLGTCLVWSAAGLAMQNTDVFLCATVLILLAYFYRIRNEESMLIRQFGDAYREYTRHSWRLIPFIW